MRSIDLISLSGGVPTTLSSRPEGMFLLTELGEIQVLSTDLEVIGEWLPPVSVDKAMMSMNIFVMSSVSAGSRCRSFIDAS